MYIDAHIHLFDFYSMSGAGFVPAPDMRFCVSACRTDEFFWQEEFARQYPGQIVLSFGIHPQDPSDAVWPFLQGLVREHRISAIGECGFDRFTADFRANMAAQRSAWDLQLDLAVSSGLPLIVHCRKALNEVFADTRRLSKLPSVIFHGWTGSLREAESLLKRGVNGYFCSGKALLRGDKSLKETILGLPLSRILTETDAPWMRSRDQIFSTPDDIRELTAYTAEIVGVSVAELSSQVFANFKRVFPVQP
jgi:TatD DNase family protein